jgi:DNA-binding winged helix-turn-helix (wHTH) protein
MEVLAQVEGETVNKYELMGRVWPEAIVEGNTPQFRISVARKARESDRGQSLSPYRIVTLTGPCRVGKTALAPEVALN